MQHHSQQGCHLLRAVGELVCGSLGDPGGAVLLVGGDQHHLNPSRKIHLPQILRRVNHTQLATSLLERHARLDELGCQHHLRPGDDHTALLGVELAEPLVDCPRALAEVGARELLLPIAGSRVQPVDINQKHTLRIGKILRRPLQEFHRKSSVRQAHMASPRHQRRPRGVQHDRRVRRGVHRLVGPLSRGHKQAHAVELLHSCRAPLLAAHGRS
mmetsp:Transcript_9483/g.24121  ORF Transcript_9483/g.24121 Transcript_9483/m.24121 type:complete len:214 (-) Transcript_9483:13-654(-)